ncbi:hypothetical protein [Jiangella asiatica]|uniref:Uncharacterized protein n=1 Tax=Jiangella asiatica TaxID=2530372 RepID=A0A4R5D932_9ACTN|nr:hypothetical protein [Jiangella asiatica]TDE10092.1 hypothetical protein E1269_12280 [Jiangella asiatica]
MEPLLSSRQLRRVGVPFRWLGRATWFMLGFMAVAMTGAAFRDDVEWQFSVPLVLVLVAAFGLLVALGLFATREGRRWRRAATAQRPDRVLDAVVVEKGRNSTGSILHVKADDGSYLLRTRHGWDLDSEPDDRIHLQLYGAGPKVAGAYRNERGGRPAAVTVTALPV